MFINVGWQRKVKRGRGYTREVRNMTGIEIRGAKWETVDHKELVKFLYEEKMPAGGGWTIQGYALSKKRSRKNDL